MNVQNVEHILSNATCSIIIDGDIAGTAWLISEQGWLLSAAHVLGRIVTDKKKHNILDDVVTHIKVRFLDQPPSIAHVIHWSYSYREGIDFALLKLETPVDIKPLPIADIQSIRDEFIAIGYGQTLKAQSQAKGNFLGAIYLDGVRFNTVFQLDSKQLEQGFSGAAIFSTKVNAVVGVLTELTPHRLGAARDSAIAMPIFRIIKQCVGSKLLENIFQNISIPNAGNSRISVDRLAGNFSNSDLERTKKFFREKSGRKVTFLLVGRVGVGKSSTINSLLGEDVAKVGRWEPTTLKVLSYETTIANVDIRVYDTPGLCDAPPEKGKDDIYIQQIKRTVSSVDCVLYVTKLGEERVRLDEIRAIEIFSKAFGPDIWEKTVLVFSHADQLANLGEYHEALEHRPMLIKREIMRYVDFDVSDIPYVAVTNITELDLDGEYWVANLFSAIMNTMSDDAAFSFFIAKSKDIQEGGINLNKEQQKAVRNIINKVIEGAGIGFGTTLLSHLGMVALAIHPATHVVGIGIGVVAGAAWITQRLSRK